MPNKTILQLTGMESTEYGAMEHYLLELARFCRQKGYHSVLQYEVLSQSAAYLRDLESLGASVTILTINDVNPLQSVQRIATLIRAVRPEIIHAHFVNRYVLFSTPIIAQVFGVQKIITTVHGVPHLRENSPRRLAYNQYDHVIGVSRAIADDLLYAGTNPKVVSTHYLGLFGHREKSEQLRSQFRAEFGIPEQAIVIACIAFDVPTKGLDVLLDALAKVVHHHPQIRLVVVGVDPRRSALPEQAARLGLSNHVHWAGIRDEGWRILNAADIYVQPSRSEGIGFATMEASSLKLPVVATRVGGIPEVIVDDETGYLAEPDSVDSLASTFERLLAEPSKWKTMGEAGYGRYVRMFRGENSVKTLVEKYFELGG